MVALQSACALCHEIDLFICLLFFSFQLRCDHCDHYDQGLIQAFSEPLIPQGRSSPGPTNPRSSTAGSPTPRRRPVIFQHVSCSAYLRVNRNILFSRIFFKIDSISRSTRTPLTVARPGEVIAISWQTYTFFADRCRNNEPNMMFYSLCVSVWKRQETQGAELNLPVRYSFN